MTGPSTTGTLDPAAFSPRRGGVPHAWAYFSAGIGEGPMKADRALEGLARRVQKPEVEQIGLFESGPAWQEHWWGMPAFVQGNAQPAHSITVNFMCFEDVLEFGRRLGLKPTRRTDSAWFPVDDLDVPSEWEYVNEP